MSLGYTNTTYPHRHCDSSQGVSAKWQHWWEEEYSCIPRDTLDNNIIKAMIKYLNHLIKTLIYIWWCGYKHTYVHMCRNAYQLSHTHILGVQDDNAIILIIVSNWMYLSWIQFLFSFRRHFINWAFFILFVFHTTPLTEQTTPNFVSSMALWCPKIMYFHKKKILRGPLKIGHIIHKLKHPRSNVRK